MDVKAQDKDKVGLFAFFSFLKISWVVIGPARSRTEPLQVGAL